MKVVVLGAGNVGSQFKGFRAKKLEKIIINFFNSQK